MYQFLLDDIFEGFNAKAKSDLELEDELSFLPRAIFVHPFPTLHLVYHSLILDFTPYSKQIYIGKIDLFRPVEMQVLPQRPYHILYTPPHREPLHATGTFHI